MNFSTREYDRKIRKIEKDKEGTTPMSERQYRAPELKAKASQSLKRVHNVIDLDLLEPKRKMDNTDST